MISLIGETEVSLPLVCVWFRVDLTLVFVGVWYVFIFFRPDWSLVSVMWSLVVVGNKVLTLSWFNWWDWSLTSVGLCLVFGRCSSWKCDFSRTYKLYSTHFVRLKPYFRVGVLYDWSYVSGLFFFVFVLQCGSVVFWGLPLVEWSSLNFYKVKTSTRYSHKCSNL